MLALLDRMGGAISGVIGAGARSIENPAVPISSDAAFEYLGGSRSDAGVVVSRRTALALSAFWCGVMTIAEAMASLGVDRLLRVEGGGKRKDIKSPLYRLVNEEPNPWMDDFNFVRTAAIHMIAEGNGYAYIVRDGNEPVELWPLLPHETSPVEVTEYATGGSELWYLTTITIDGKSQRVKIPDADMLHFRGPGPTGLLGYNPLEICRDAIGGAIATKKYATTFFKRGTMTAGIIKHPSKITAESKTALRDDWDRLHSGLDNAHRPAILDNGMDFQSLGMDAEKAQLIESRKFDIIEIANVLRIRPHMIGDTSRQGYNSLEMEDRSFLRYTLNPWLKAMEGEFNRKLRTEKEKRERTVYYSFNRKAAVEMDAKTEADVIKSLVDGGMIMVDDALTLLDMNPLPNGHGQVIKLQTNNVKLIDATRPPKSADDAAADADLEFKRSVVKAFIADGTIGDVVFNSVEAVKLLESVNLPTLPNFEEPWLPVVAQAGPLVSGETILDDAGDVVGGDVEGDASGSDGSGDPADASADSVDKNTDMSDPDAVRAAFTGVVRAAVARRRSELACRRAVEVDTWARLTRRVAHMAERAAAKPDGYNAFVEELESKLAAEFTATVTPVLGLRGVRGKAVAATVKRYFNWLRKELLTVAECSRSELAGKVGEWVKAVTR